MSFLLLGVLNSQAAGGAITSEMELIQTINVTGTPTTLTFSNIPQTYRHLHLRGQVYSDGGSTTGIFLRANGNTGGMTAQAYVRGSDWAIAGERTNWAQFAIGGSQSNPASFVYDIPNYKLSNARKIGVGIYGSSEIGSTGARTGYRVWGTTTDVIGAITQLELVYDNSRTFESPTTVSLYGVL